MTGRPEPELELVRKAAPVTAPAFVVALTIGSAAGGWGTGWSAAIGVAVVSLNFVASGLSMARAARISLMALAAVGMAGWVLRLALIVGLMFFLNGFHWFSPLAFGLAVVPATLLLLAYEMKLLARGHGHELVLLPAAKEEAAQ
jgi:hypothetical protein